MPDGVELIFNPLGRLRDGGIDVQIVPNLWAMHDAIAASTLSSR